VESSLHRALKARYGGEAGAYEVRCSGFRADAVSPDGAWIEVQSGPMAPLRVKLERLLPSRRVVVVKPFAIERRIVRRRDPDGADVSSRRSPRRGQALDVFEDLMGLARVFPHENLRIDVLGVAVDEVRVPVRRRPGYQVVDRRLVEVRAAWELRTAPDLWGLLPSEGPAEGGPFTTLDLADRLQRGLAFAQRVAYCLRLTGAAEAIGKQGNRIIYRRAVEARSVGSGTGDLAAFAPLPYDVGSR
jgi:hypothetical protein